MKEYSTKVDFKKYQEYIQSPEWYKRKQKYYSKHKKECYGCGSKERLNLHHRSYTSLYNEKDKHLVPVCGTCHDKIHELARNLDIGMRKNKWKISTHGISKKNLKKMNLIKFQFHLPNITDLVLKEQRLKRMIKENTKTKTITYTSKWTGEKKTKTVTTGGQRVKAWKKNLEGNYEGKRRKRKSVGGQLSMLQYATDFYKSGKLDKFKTVAGHSYLTQDQIFKAEFEKKFGIK